MSKLIKESEIVVTIDGSTALKGDCRRINGEYYKIGINSKENTGQCYYINGKYYKGTTGYIVFDHTIKEYVIKNQNSLLEGVVGFDGETIIKGFFSTNNREALPVLSQSDGQQFYCVNSKILKNSPYQFNLYLSMYTHRLSRKVSEYINPGQVDRNVKNRLPYDSRGGMDALIKQHKSYSPTISEAVENYGAILGDLTFGVEFETTKGQIAHSKCNELGLMALRDGSVGGLEYATIPLQGKKGIQTLINSVDELRAKTTYDKSCSLHFHIGNIPRTESFFLALFKVLGTIENQMYDLVPLYKKYNLGVKRKHYTKPFPLDETMFQFDKVINKDNMKDNFAILYKYLSMGQTYSNVDSNLDNVTCHPSDPHGTSKWNIRSRYHWVNLIPLLFGNKQTVEFRLHTPTYDIEKIMHHLILCASIINFVKQNTKNILENPSILMNLKTSDIIYKCASSLNSSKLNQFAEYAYEYLRSRKDHFYVESSQGNINGDEDSFLFRNRIKWSDNISSSVQLSKLKCSKIHKNYNFSIQAGSYRDIVNFMEEREPQELEANPVTEVERTWNTVLRRGSIR